MNPSARETYGKSMSAIPRLNVLFVCSINQWRSPTAEALYRHDSRMNVRSAGTSAAAAHRISQKDLDWADVIIAMEDEHQARIRELFSKCVLPPIEVLGIEDHYPFQDPELIELLREGVEEVMVRRLNSLHHEVVYADQKMTTRCWRKKYLPLELTEKPYLPA